VANHDVTTTITPVQEPLPRGRQTWRLWSGDFPANDHLIAAIPAGGATKIAVVASAGDAHTFSATAFAFYAAGLLPSGGNGTATVGDVKLSSPVGTIVSVAMNTGGRVMEWVSAAGVGQRLAIDWFKIDFTNGASIITKLAVNVIVDY